MRLVDPSWLWSLLDRVPGPDDRPAGRRRLVDAAPSATRALIVRGLLAVTFTAVIPALLPAESVLPGLPVTRFYSFEEMGDITRATQLTTDAHGRVAAIQDGAFVVLNDNTWIDIADKSSGIQVLQTVHDRDGTTYFCALGTWGTLTTGSSGMLRPIPNVPPDCPKWVQTTSFNQIVCTPDTICFAGWNGIVLFDRKSRRHHFFEVPAVVLAFELHGKVHISSHNRGVMRYEAASAALVAVDRSVIGEVVFSHCAAIDNDHVLATSTYRQLMVYGRDVYRRLPGPVAGRLPGPVTSLLRLAEGDFAMSVTNAGLFIIDREGRVKMSLTTPEYGRITALASNEPGVLWASAETGIIKILYSDPLTIFGQRLGLPVRWPQLRLWNGRTIVVSDGRLYEPAPGNVAGAPARFQLMPNQPYGGTWGIATPGAWLLTGNAEGVFGRRPDSNFQLVLPRTDAARLVALDDETCLVIGGEEIAALRCRDGQWSEIAPRVKALGYPSMVHRAGRSAWVELGIDRAVRFTLRSDRIETQVFDSFPWERGHWISVSVAGDIVMLNGSGNDRLFFDEKRESLTDAPALTKLLSRSPYPVGRFARDEAGTFWLSHDHGVLALRPKGNDYVVDTISYDLIRERVPLVHPLAPDDVWVSTGDALYHLDSTRSPSPPPTFQPNVVSVLDSRTRAEISRYANERVTLPAIPYRQNSLTFGFFAGSYRSRRPPTYEFRLNDERWTSLGTLSTLALSDLREGAYRLEVRLVDRRGPVGESRSIRFTILPPWYRTWYAFGAYALLATGAVIGFVRYSVRRAEGRSAELEKVVEKRTAELTAAMHRLEQETKTAATLAERNRLAGEIHDSLEQGFTGLTLQLETTANFKGCPPEIRKALEMALNMVDFSRNEVRHAVQNLHSPILDSADLETALRQIVRQICPFDGYATTVVHGDPRPLGSTVDHHLLRIAQEAVTNAVKHAAATRLTIALTFTPGAVELSVEDNGRGFDATVVLNGAYGHFGLPSFRGRASKIGGTVEIKSRVGAGTRITVRVPTPSLATVI